MYDSNIYDSDGDEKKKIDAIKDFEVVKLLDGSTNLFKIQRSNGIVGFVYYDNILVLNLQLNIEYIDEQWRITSF